jgi:hypothetical protein
LSQVADAISRSQGEGEQTQSVASALESALKCSDQVSRGGLLQLGWEQQGIWKEGLHVNGVASGNVPMRLPQLHEGSPGFEADPDQFLVCTLSCAGAPFDLQFICVAHAYGTWAYWEMFLVVQRRSAAFRFHSLTRVEHC